MSKKDSPTSSSPDSNESSVTSGNFHRRASVGEIVSRVALSATSIFTVGHAIAPDSASANIGTRIEATETSRKVDNFDLKIGLRSWKTAVHSLNFSEVANMDPAKNGLGEDILEYFTSQLNVLKNPDTLPSTVNTAQALQDTVIFLEDEEEVSVVKQWILFGAKDNPQDPSKPIFTPDALDPSNAAYYGLYVDKNGQWQRFYLGGTRVGLSGVPGNRMVGLATRNGGSSRIVEGNIGPNSFTADGLILQTTSGQDIIFGPAETFPTVKKAAKATLLGTHFQPVTLRGMSGSIK